MAPARLLLSIGMLLFMFIPSFLPAAPVHAQSTQTTSVVRIDPISSCCIVPGASFTVNVVLDLAPGESVNGFDIRINYTNPQENGNPTGLQAASLNYAGNIFDPSGSVTVDCINDIAAQNTGSCPSDDSPYPGQIHLQEVLLGQQTTASGRLFSIAFVAHGYNPSVFAIDRANLINPHGDPSNPQMIDPVFIPVVKQDGVFGNAGVVAFFNFQPHDTSVSPALLPNQQIDFDATPSFVGNNTSVKIVAYSWRFPGGFTATGNMTRYSFSSPGNYSVTLTATDAKNEKGNITRTVSIVPAFGRIDLVVKDQGGNILTALVTIRIYNSSLDARPFQVNVTSTEAKFNHLSPSTYYVSFTGPTIENSSKTENVVPGWTTQDSLYLKLTPAPANYSILIYTLSLVAALGALTGAIVYQKRSSRKNTSRRSRRLTNNRHAANLDEQRGNFRNQ